jgi:4-amino-4-deoxy-L-arabinose transferase-like glycosyltransferase
MTRADNVLSLRSYILLALLALAFFLPGISALPPIDRDEPRYTQATTQMLESGDFVDIRFMDQVRYKQPAGIYWIQAASAALFEGIHTGSVWHDHKIWAHRLPSALNGMIAVLLSAWLGAAFFGRKAGLAAGAMMACCFSLTFESHIAKIDATLCMVTLAAQVCLARMRLDAAEAKPAGWKVASLFWLILGIGVMIKGPVPILVSGGTIVLVSLWERSTDLLKRLRAFPLILIALAVCLPWLIAIGVKSHGEFFQSAVGKNFVGKIANGQESHGAPPGYHLALFSAMFWPSALFAVASIPAIWKHRRDPRVRFLVSWIVPSWLVFELIATKLPHYVLPTYPAIAVLAAGAWFGDLRMVAGKVGVWLGRLYAVVWATVGLTLAAASPVALYVLEKRIDALSIALAVVAGAAILACLGFLATGKKGEALIAAVFAALIAWFNLFAWSAPKLETMWLSPRVVAAVQANAPCPHPVLASAPFQEASLAFLAGTSTRFVAPTAVADSLASNPACGMALIGAKEYPVFAAELASRGVAVQKVAEIDGRNYANNDKLQLGLYRAVTPGAESSPSAASPKTQP